MGRFTSGSLPRSRAFLSGPFLPFAALAIAVTAVAVSAAPPRVPLGTRDDLTAAQASRCPPTGDDGKVTPRGGDAKVSAKGKNTDWLIAKWHWDDLKGHDLTVEEWCINQTPDFEPYFSLRVVQSEYEIKNSSKPHKEHIVVIPGASPTPPPATPTPTPSPSPSPTPSLKPGETPHPHTVERTPTPTPTPAYGGFC